MAMMNVPSVPVTTLAGVVESVEDPNFTVMALAGPKPTPDMVTFVLPPPVAGVNVMPVRDDDDDPPDELGGGVVAVTLKLFVAVFEASLTVIT